MRQGVLGIGLLLVALATVVVPSRELSAAGKDAVISIGQTGWGNSWMYRIDRSGNVLWQKSLPFVDLPIWHWVGDRNVEEDALYLPIFGDGNRVGGNNRVQKYDADGNLAWDAALFPNLVNVSANPALGGCYVADQYLGVYRLDGAGNVVWGPLTFGVDHPIGSANWTVTGDPVTGGGFACHVDHWAMSEVVRFDRNGRVVWMTSLYYVSYAKANPIDGGVYVVHEPYGGSTTRFEPDGSPLWTLSCVPSCYNYPHAVSPVDGSMTISSGWPAYLAHIALDGTVRWAINNDNGSGYAFANLSLSASADEDAFFGGAASNTPGVGKYRGSDGSEVWFVNPGNGGDQFHVWMGTPSLLTHSPVIRDVVDVPNDQGGRLRVMWDASNLDAPLTRGIASYTVWRRLVATEAQAALASGAQLLAGDDAPSGVKGRAIRASSTGAQSTFWEFVASVPAMGVRHYATMVATGSDSMPGLVPYEVFLVDAREAASTRVHMSLPDSGYSVDNLAPATPASLTGAYAAGATWLHWDRNLDADLAGYAIDRAPEPAGPWTRIATPPDTGYADAGSAGRCYRVSALDVHGNKSEPALLTVEGTLGVPPGSAGGFVLEAIRPNPSRGIRIGIELALRAGGAVRVELMDVSGRRICTRDISGFGAGRHRFDLVPGERLAAGLYLLRLTQAGETRIGRVAVVD